MLETMDLICSRLDPHRPRPMGRRNLDRLAQLDDPANVARLLAFPAEEAARAQRLSNPIRRAKGMERALAISLLIYTGLRIKNLRHIRLDRDLRRAGEAVMLKVDAAEVKNGQELQFELPDETRVLLEDFLTEHRKHIPGHVGPYLFPGKEGGAKTDSAMRRAVAEPLREHCGLIMSPHLFRHAIAKIVTERDPGMYAAVSRHLGHRSMSTTLGFYLGGETRAASRRLNRLLQDARDNPELKDL